MAEHDERWRLLDTERFLERSLEDARAEHRAGELGDEELAAIEARDGARLAEVRLELEAHAEPSLAPRSDPPVVAAAEQLSSDPPPTRRRRRRPGLLIGGLFLVVLGLVGLLAATLGVRLPGQEVTGGGTEAAARVVHDQLLEAGSLVQQGNLSGALALYDQVLAKDPQQPEALAEAGWLTYEAGVAGRSATLATTGEQLVDRAAAVDPALAAAHLFLGAIALDLHHDPHRATDEFKAFLLLSPTSAQVAQAKPFIDRAFAATGTVIPPGL